jgi:hypothetical protein
VICSSSKTFQNQNDQISNLGHNSSFWKRAEGMGRSGGGALEKVNGWDQAFMVGEGPNVLERVPKVVDVGEKV